MELSPSVLIWQGLRGAHPLRCIVEQIGEECFELRLYWGKTVLVEETFEEIPKLLARVADLRAQFDQPAPRRRVAVPA